MAELEAKIFRIKNGMNRAKNGVKRKKLAVITRLRERCLRWLSALRPAKSGRGGGMTAVLSQDASFLRDSFERGPGFSIWDYSVRRLQAELPSICVAYALVVRPRSHQESNRLLGVPDDLKTKVDLQRNVRVPGARGYGGLGWTGFPKTHISGNCPSGTALYAGLASSSGHLRGDVRARNRTDRRCLTGADVGLRLLDRGLRQIWRNIRRQVRRECGVWKVRYRGSRHESLLFGSATATERYLFPRTGG